MGPPTPVTWTTPDGVARPLRYTFGALRRIVDRLGCQFGEALQKYGEAVMPEILYCCMFDKDGKPPEGLDPVRFAEEADPDSHFAMLAKLEAACPPGKTKNALRATLRAWERIQETQAMQVDMMLGSASGASPDSASMSASPNSGSLPHESSTNSATDTEKNAMSAAVAPV